MQIVTMNVQNVSYLNILTRKSKETFVCIEQMHYFCRNFDLVVGHLNKLTEQRLSTNLNNQAKIKAELTIFINKT